MIASNQPDGSVYVEVEGDDAAVDRFVAWCRQGPPSAQVNHVETAEAVTAGLRGFTLSTMPTFLTLQGIFS